MRIKEEWKPIPDWPYEASSLGRIRRIGKPQPLKSRVNTANGYNMLALVMNGKRMMTTVAPLICRAFYGPRPTPSHEAAHDNGIRTDDRSDNLSWKTRSENEADKVRHGRIPLDRTMTPTKTVLKIRTMAKQGTPYNQIAWKFGLAPSSVSMIVRKLRRANI